MSFPRWPINDPILKDNKPLPVWQRWLSSVVAQLINGVFTTLRVTGSSDDGSLVAFTVGDSTGWAWTPHSAFAVISNGPGSDNVLFIGPDPTTNLQLEGFSGGGIVGTEGRATPIYVDASAVYINTDTSGPVGIGFDAPSAHLHIVAGSAAASTAPLKLTPGTLLTVPELGAVEFTDDGADGHLYITLNVASVLTRVQIV